jgi:C-terminal processing protease CtpA/Prc
MARHLLRSAALAVALALGLSTPAAAQINLDRQRGLQMLDQIHKDLVEHYFDPTFHGIDLGALVARARQRITAAESLGEIFAILGGLTLDLRDSHTMFDPPQRVQEVRYGWSWRATGDRLLIAAVAADSDAKAKGLRVGDAIVEVAGYTVTRANHGTLEYLLWTLRPQPRLRLVVERDGARRTLDIESRFVTHRTRLDLSDDMDRAAFLFQEALAQDGPPAPFHEWLADGVLYWRVPSLRFEAVRLGRHERAVRKATKLILDLRGNSGGAQGAMLEAASFFARDTEVLTRVTRKAREVLRTRKGGTPAAAEIVVLVDSHTASAAEILARFLQLRGARVVGDRTSGAVTNGWIFRHTAGDGEIKVLYRMYVAVADGVMPDGNRLEGVGVAPDVVALPTPDDLERRLDPVLAQAAAAFGITLDPQKAARLSRRPW